jgi:hypothetical protein
MQTTHFRIGIRAISATIASAVAGPVCWGGVVVLSRHSLAHIAGGSAAEPYDLLNSSDAAGAFSINLGPDNVPTGAEANAMANQDSSLNVSAGTLRGAAIDGAVRAGLEPAGETPLADSSFDLVFGVTRAPARFSVSGMLSASGQAAATVELIQESSGLTPLFEQILPGATADHPLDAAGVLIPGTYEFTARAMTGGTEDPSSALFHVNFDLTSLAVGGTPPPPPPISGSTVPLPQALWPATAVLLVCAAGCHRRRRPVAR